MLHRHAGQVGAIDVGYRPGPSAIKQVCYRHFRHDLPTDNQLTIHYDLQLKPKVLYMMGADEGVIQRQDLASKAFVIYQGHHGDKGAEMADAVLPGNGQMNGQYISHQIKNS